MAVQTELTRIRQERVLAGGGYSSAEGQPTVRAHVLRSLLIVAMLPVVLMLARLVVATARIG